MPARKYLVPSKDYGLQYRGLLPDLLPEIERVLLEEEPVLGESLAAFEGDFALYTGTAHAIGVNSGTDALSLALRALGVEPGREVVTQANTFMATLSAIVMAGARPVLIDPDPLTLNMSGESLAPTLGPRTAAVIPVHLYGALCPMAEIVGLCGPLGVAVVEDAAQAHGARSASGLRAGAFGRLGAFSFHPSKNLGAFGDGGMITTSDGEIARRLRVLRNLGKVTKYDIGFVAPNTKLDTLQAAILRVKLRRLDAWNDRRRRIATSYRERLQDSGDLLLPHDPGGQAHVYHQFVIRTQRRDALRRHLRENGINAGLHYPVPPHLQKLDMDFGWRPGRFPVAEESARTVLSLPVSPELTDEQVEHVCAQVKRFFDG